MLSRVELFERIRRDRRLDAEVSHRELARRYGVHRRSVRLALGSAVPPERKKPARSRALLLDPVTEHIDAMLRADLTAPRKQRHTIQRIYDRLLVEYDFKLACYSTVAHYVKKRRPQIIAGARDGHEHVQGMVDAKHSFDQIWNARVATNPAGRFGQPAELGAYCAFLCSTSAGFVTGQNLLIDGGSYPGTY